MLRSVQCQLELLIPAIAEIHRLELHAFSRGQFLRDGHRVAIKLRLFGKKVDAEGVHVDIVKLFLRTLGRYRAPRQRAHAACCRCGVNDLRGGGTTSHGRGKDRNIEAVEDVAHACPAYRALLLFTLVICIDFELDMPDWTV